MQTSDYFSNNFDNKKWRCVAGVGENVSWHYLKQKNQSDSSSLWQCLWPELKQSFFVNK